MDEYVGIERDHPQSYHHYMWSTLYRHIDISPQNVHILDGNAADLDAECESYEKKMASHGGVELFIGGTGPDGHIGFNEPGSSLESRTRVKTLAHSTGIVLSKERFLWPFSVVRCLAVTEMLPLFNGDIVLVPKRALTIGVGSFMDAKEVMVVMTSTRKSKALAR